jgi:hypothetical protein
MLSSGAPEYLTGGLWFESRCGRARKSLQLAVGEMASSRQKTKSHDVEDLWQSKCLVRPFPACSGRLGPLFARSATPAKTWSHVFLVRLRVHDKRLALIVKRLGRAR